jgi:hypothetical protein
MVSCHRGSGLPSSGSSCAARRRWSSAADEDPTTCSGGNVSVVDSSCSCLGAFCEGVSYASDRPGGGYAGPATVPEIFGGLPGRLLPLELELLLGARLTTCGVVTGPDGPIPAVTGLLGASRVELRYCGSRGRCGDGNN